MRCCDTSKPRYPWWGYVKNIVRRYPMMRREYDEAMQQKITPAYAEMTRSSDATRTTELSVACAAPSSGSVAELEAVQKAIDSIATTENGDEIIKIIDMLFWKQTHTLQGAALNMHLSYNTAKRRYEAFLKSVAYYRGLL